MGKTSSDKNQDILSQDKEICGLIMPISSSNEYSAEHWIEVKEIICECVIEAGFTPKLVSEATDTGIIHQRIVENIYQNPIVVCDISSRNPNVMFELGIRLTFDKPVVIIKDDATDRIFDTDIIEYLSYPKNLRYSTIQAFKQNLISKILATYKKYNNSDASFFIKNFKNVKAQKLQDEELGSTQLILRAIEDLKREYKTPSPKQSVIPKTEVLNNISDSMAIEILEKCLEMFYENDFDLVKKDSLENLKENLKKSFQRVISGKYVGYKIDELETRIQKLIKTINRCADMNAATLDIIL